MYLLSGSEGEVEAEIEVEVGVEGDALLGEFAGDVVGGYEEVEARGFEIDDASERGPECAHAYVDACGDEADGLDVGREAEVGPGEGAVEACGAQESEFGATVDGECVLCGEVHRGSDA